MEGWRRWHGRPEAVAWKAGGSGVEGLEAVAWKARGGGIEGCRRWVEGRRRWVEGRRWWGGKPEAWKAGGVEGRRRWRGIGTKTPGEKNGESYPRIIFILVDESEKYYPSMDKLQKMPKQIISL